MSESRGCSGTWPLDSAVIIELAREYGEPTPASLERLSPELDTSVARMASRREDLERIAGRQAMRLFEVMDGLLPTQYRDVPTIRAILARSYGVGIGFALLPNRENATGPLNEETALDHVCYAVDAWLQFDEPAGRFTYTEDAQERLREAYVPGGGCPLVGLEVEGASSAETLNLFMLYWGHLASEYEPRNLPS